MTGQSTTWDGIHQHAADDPWGTVRVCDKYGTVAVYVKVGADSWRCIYVDGSRGEHLCPATCLSDSVAGWHPAVFVPKTVGSQHE